MKILACVTKPGLDHWISLKSAGRTLTGIFFTESTREHRTIFDTIYDCRYSCLLESSPKKLVNSNYGNKSYRKSLALSSVIFDQIVIRFHARSTDASAIDIRVSLDDGTKDRIITKPIISNWLPQTLKIDLPQASHASKLDLSISASRNSAEINNLEVTLTCNPETAISYVSDFQLIAVDDRANQEIASRFGESILAWDAPGDKLTKTWGEKPNSPKVSILTLTYNGRHLLQKCAHYLLKNTNSLEYEWLILDDHSEDDTKQYYERELQNHKNIFYFRPHYRIQNFSKGNNYLARLARGKYLVFLNNDAYLQPNCLSLMIKRLENDPTIGTVGGLLLFPDTKKIQHAGVVFLANGPQRGMPHHMLINEEPGKHSVFLKQPRMFQAVTAACSAMPKSLYDNVGGYDESFEFGYEDVDLCMRLQKLDYKIVLEPGSTAYHEQNATHPITEKENRGWELKKHLKNKEILNRKWASEIVLDSDMYTRDINFNVYKQNTQEYSVAYVPYTRGDGNDIYRTDLMVQGLNLAKVNASVLDHHNPVWPEKADIIVLQRFIQTLSTQKFFRELKARYPKAKIGYDIDDYIFDKRLYESVRSSPGMSPEVMDAYRRTMAEQADFFLTTTNYLSGQLINTFRTPSFMVPNSVDTTFIGEKLSAKEGIVIGYASGTKTHDNDFLTALGPINAVMNKYPNVRLLILGHLNVPPSLIKRFNHRIERIPFVPFNQFQSNLARFDINISPLCRSQFNDAKSPLKYTEAGALGIPTVASLAAGYTEVLEDGVNGFLCSTNKEWVDKLGTLIESQTLRTSMGKIAKKDVTEKYTIVSAGKTLAKIFAGILEPSYKI